MECRYYKNIAIIEIDISKAITANLCRILDLEFVVRRAIGSDLEPF